MSILVSLNSEIVRLERIRNDEAYGYLKPKIEEQIAVARFCLDLVSRVQNQPAKNPLSDFVFRLVTKRSVSIRTLIGSIACGRQASITATIGIRRATLSEYLNGRRAMSADSVEAILNLGAVDSKK